MDFFLPPPKKALGQHFLHDPATIGRMVATISPQLEDTIVEVGPGRGALTRPLLERGFSLTVVEFDTALIPLLEKLASSFEGNLQIHHANALRFDFCALVKEGRPLRLIGNLPYNLSTPLLFHFIAQGNCIQEMYLLLQKEVVARMAALPGGKEYGRLSVMLQYHCKVEPLFHVGAGAFTPPPKVESTFVRLIPHLRPVVEVTDYPLFSRLVAGAFSHRRKTLRNALRDEVTMEMFQLAGIDPQQRAETVSLEQYARLSQLLVDGSPAQTSQGE